VIRVRDRESFDAARSAFEQVAPKEIKSYARGGVRVEAADFSYGYLAKQREAIFENLFATITGVTSLDLNEARNRVVIGIDKSRARQVSAALDEAIMKLGLDPSAIEISQEDPPRLAAIPAPVSRHAAQMSPTTLDGVFPTLVGGINIFVSAVDPIINGTGAGGNCSLGFTTTYIPSGGGTPYQAIVTNSHCTKLWGAPDSTALYQGPSYFGFSTVDPHKTYCAGNWCRMADAALFKITTGNIEVGLIARPLSNSIVLDAASPYFVIREVAASSPPMGTIYHKVGHTTGFTSGFIWQACADHHWGYAWPDQYVTRCGDSGTAASEDGDSGGSVFIRLDTNNVRLIGISVGKNDQKHFWSPYHRIVANLGGAFQVVRPATLVAPSSISGIVSTTPGQAFIYWPASSGASEYELQGEDWEQQCDPYWGCSVVNVGTWTVRVLGTSYTDTRSVFYGVVPHGTPAYTYTKYRVLAKNPMTGSFSVLGDSVRFSR